MTFTTLFELAPTDLEARVWRLTRYKGPVIVRALNENHARRLASQSFQMHPQPTEDSVSVWIGDPWHSGGCVSCAVLPASEDRWPDDGRCGVVFPKDWKERRGLRPPASGEDRAEVRAEAAT